MKLYFDSLTTLKVIHAESPVVIFFGTYGIYIVYMYVCVRARNVNARSSIIPHSSERIIYASDFKRSSMLAYIDIYSLGKCMDKIY